MRAHHSGLFITATDTGTGKTTFATQLTCALRSLQWYVRVRKPVESGCVRDADGQLQPADAVALHRASGALEHLDSVVPYRLEAAISPARAASLEGLTLTIDQLARACRQDVEPGDFLLVEGAGGFYSPLASDGLNADLASHLALPLLILAPDRLGVIGHILLTLEAAARRGLPVAGVVLNRLPDPARPAHLDNLIELSALVGDVPLHSVLTEADMQPLAAALARRFAR